MTNFNSLGSRLIAAGLALMLLGGVLLGAQLLRPSPANQTFDQMLSIARAADTELDALDAAARIRYEVPEGSSQTGLDAEWLAIRPTTRDELVNWAVAILNMIQEESGLRVLVSDVTFREYGPFTRSMIAGTFSPDTSIVALNIKYINDPSWGTDNYMGVLVHELIHAAGFHNESQTQIMTLEVLSSMSALGYPGMRAVLMGEIRGYAIRTAYLMASRGYAPIASTYANRCRDNGCGTGERDEDLIAQWNETRAELYSVEELRYGNKRVAFWENAEANLGANYAGVLLAYSMRPMLASVAGACSADHLMPEPFQNERVPKLDHGVFLGETEPGDIPGPWLDDLYSVYRELGVC